MTNVKIAFVIDSTASMAPWIHAAKTKIGEIVDNVMEIHPNAHFEIALVAYRDYGDLIRFRTVDFTSPEVVMHALQNVRAEGGQDEAEDVATALLHATRLSWDDADVNMIFHIADSPAHGTAFHPPHISDRYPQGDPGGLDPRHSLRFMCRVGISYTFVKITSATDTMLDVFFNAWRGVNGTFQVVDLSPQTVGRADASDMLSPAVSRAVSQAIDQHTFSQGM
jgi:hypothetical protein